MKEELSVIKTIDELGRIALPRDIRKLVNMKEGSQVELGVQKDKIIISKYSPMNTLREWSGCIVKALSTVIEHDILLTDLEKVINANKKKYILKTLSGETQELLYKREIVIKKAQEDSMMINIFEESTSEDCCQLIVPVIKNNDIIGSLIVLASEDKCFDDDCVKICKAFANFLDCVIV